MSIAPIIFLILATAVLDPLKATNTNTVPGGSLDDQFKCGGCPCNQPCYTSPPPPPPPPPSKKPSPIPSLNCPPPPSYIYTTGPPGNLYPVDPFSQSSNHRQILLAPSIIVVIGVLGMLAS
ncbi:hypothetical protein R6Q59_012158 [Mikania micrantha]